MRRILVLILPLLIMSACERAWNSANRTPLEKDVRSLLKSCGPVPALLKCGMAGTTREAWAAFNATPAHVNVLVKCLNLKPADPDSDLWRVASYKEAQTPAVDMPSTASQFTEMWGMNQRVPLKSGSAFSYLILIFDSTTGRAGFRMAYSYG